MVEDYPGIPLETLHKMMARKEMPRILNNECINRYTPLDFVKSELRCVRKPETPWCGDCPFYETRIYDPDGNLESSLQEFQSKDSFDARVVEMSSRQHIITIPSDIVRGLGLVKGQTVRVTLEIPAKEDDSTSKDSPKGDDFTAGGQPPTGSQTTGTPQQQTVTGFRSTDTQILALSQLYGKSVDEIRELMTQRIKELALDPNDPEMGSIALASVKVELGKATPKGDDSTAKEKESIVPQVSKLSQPPEQKVETPIQQDSTSSPTPPTPTSPQKQMRSVGFEET